MAIYHCRFKIHTRGKGAQASRAAAYRSGTRVTSSRVTSAVRAAAYRSGGKLEDLGGEVHDFRRKGGIVHNEIMAPEDAPAWVYNRSKLWNAVEAREDMSKRRDTAQLFREAELSIPRELSPAERIDLVQRFVQDAFVSHGMIADIGIHCPKASDGGEQPHAHVMLTMREIGPNGFGNKRRDWNGASFFNQKGKPTEAYAKDGGSLRQGRVSWQDYCNDALTRAGSGARIDHRSLDAQGKAHAPEPSHGRAAHVRERTGVFASKWEQVIRARFERKAREAVQAIGRGGRGNRAPEDSPTPSAGAASPHAAAVSMMRRSVRQTVRQGGNRHASDGVAHAEETARRLMGESLTPIAPPVDRGHDVER